MLKGEALSQAYANMDLFVFPSHTDTFGNVVLEAMASGVPAIVTPDGGPKTIVRAHALTMSWDSVFEGVYKAYEGLMTQKQQAAG